MRVTVGNKRNGDRGIYVGRPSPLGNPFDMRTESDRDRVCEQYEGWLSKKIQDRDPVVMSALQQIYNEAVLKPVKLICWCAPKRCHADTLARLLNEELAKDGEVIE